MASSSVVGGIHTLVSRFLQSAPISLERPLIVGVSGGPDSLTLLYAVSDLRNSLDLDLWGVHLDHGLRGVQGDEDARFVALELKKLDIPAIVERADVISLRDERRMSLEEAAREARYAFFHRAAQKAGAAAVLLGHTSDDQVETVLMNLIRGAGLAGLRGIEAVGSWKPQRGSRELTLVRPLLQVSREETMAYCRSRGLVPRIDESNMSTEFTRNRLRNLLIPSLEGYNPRIKNSLLRLSQSASQDLAYIEHQVRLAWPEVVEQSRSGLALRRREFSTLEPSIKSHLLRMAVKEVKGDLKNVEMRHIEQMGRLIEGPAGKHLDLPGGVALTVSYRTARIAYRDAEDCPLPPLSGEHRIQVPGCTSIPGWWVSASRVESREWSSGDPYTAYLDADAVGASRLLVRTRKDGDRFRPLGVAQESKLQDFMTDAKVPRSWRDRVPLVTSFDRITWVVGYRVADWSKVRSDTQSVLVMKFQARGESEGIK